MVTVTRIRWLFPFLVIGLLAACASAPTNKPKDALTKASYAIEQAQQAKAHQYAPRLLYNAGQKLDSAKKLAGKDNPTEQSNNKARRLAENATADAQLAQARSEAKQAEAQNRQVHKGMHVLRKEMNRTEAQ